MLKAHHKVLNLAKLFKVGFEVFIGDLTLFPKTSSILGIICTMLKLRLITRVRFGGGRGGGFWFLSGVDSDDPVPVHYLLCGTDYGEDWRIWE